MDSETATSLCDGPDPSAFGQQPPPRFGHEDCNLRSNRGVEKDSQKTIKCNEVVFFCEHVRLPKGAFFKLATPIFFDFASFLDHFCLPGVPWAHFGHPWALLGRPWGPRGEKVTKNMVRSPPSGYQFGSTFSLILRLVPMGYLNHGFGLNAAI